METQCTCDPGQTAGSASGIAADAACASRRAVAGRFDAIERSRLLGERGIGERVIDRLEQAGIHSFETLRQIGVTTAVARVCASQGHRAWRNRAAALLRVLNGFTAREL